MLYHYELVHLCCLFCLNVHSDQVELEHGISKYISFELAGSFGLGLWFMIYMEDVDEE